MSSHAGILYIVDKADGSYCIVWQNAVLSWDDDRNKLMVFPKDGPFLPTKKVGKNNPKAEFIKETNKLKDKWNDEVRRALMNGAPKESLITVKKELISKPAAESI